MPLDFRHTQFLTSAPHAAACPPDTGREVAFAGRSNAGKSSAINAITGVNGLARVSKTPGRTQLLNFFRITGNSRLVDLPGYGYARVPEAEQRRWQGMIEGYLAKRESLAGLVLIMDARHPLKPFDTQMLAWCTHHRLAVHILLTKADKLSKSQAARALQEVIRNAPGASAQLFSALKAQGVEAARAQLTGWLAAAETDERP